MSEEKNSGSDLNDLATEVLDLWQEHLAVFAADPKAKAELMRLMEPSRLLFAEWAALLQSGLYGSSNFFRGAGGANPESGAHASAPARPAPAAAATDDGALRLAQLAHRAAQLEQQVAGLEKRLAKLESGAGRTAKPPKRKKS